jgi:hypothetical protein
MDIAQILRELNAMSKHLTNTLTTTINKLNNTPRNIQRNTKYIIELNNTVYQIIDYSIASSNIGCGVCSFNNIGDG